MTAVPDAAAVTPVGVVGAWLSVWHCGTDTDTDLLAWERLPAPSRALT